MADIIKVNIGVGGVEIDVNEAIRRFGPGKKKPGVLIVAERFISLFEEHGVARAQIPRLVPEITLGDLSSFEALLPALKPSVIETAATMFAVRRAWVEGVDDVIYDRDFCFKDPKRFFSALGAIDRGASPFPVRVLFSAKQLDWRSKYYQPVVPIFAEKFGELGEQGLFRFRIFDEFDWSEKESRLQLKAMARLLNRDFHTICPLYRVPEDELADVADGVRIPDCFMRGSPIKNPSLEDYGLSAAESAAAKETEELPDVLRYLEESGSFTAAGSE